jgi:hypothetical protein
VVVLYEDSTVTLNDRGVILKAFSWRLKDRFIPYQTIRWFAVHPLTIWAGKYRFHGMGLTPVWFGPDSGRLNKERWLEIKHTGFIRAGFSPDDCAKVRSVLLQNGVLERLL